MFPNSSKDLKYLSLPQGKSTITNTQRNFNNINEERDSPDAIINFINKKFRFKSKFDKKGSEELLSSKDIALCDVMLDDQIEEDENERYNNISFMQKLTFNKENSRLTMRKIVI